MQSSSPHSPPETLRVGSTSCTSVIIYFNGIKGQVAWSSRTRSKAAHSRLASIDSRGSCKPPKELERNLNEEKKMKNFKKCISKCCSLHLVPGKRPRRLAHSAPGQANLNWTPRDVVSPRRATAAALEPSSTLGSWSRSLTRQREARDRSRLPSRPMSRAMSLKCH